MMLGVRKSRSLLIIILLFAIYIALGAVFRSSVLSLDQAIGSASKISLTETAHFGISKEPGPSEKFEKPKQVTENEGIVSNSKSKNFPQPISNSNSSIKSNGAKRNKFAYVFYITNDVYTCYAAANAERMVSKLNVGKNVDILFMAMEGTPLEKFCLKECISDQIRIKWVPPPPRITDTERYVNCYVRFEAFRLTEYERVIILDADGVLIQGVDHLFTRDLGGHSIAAGYTPHLERWLDSVLIVAVPSEELYASVAVYLNRENITKVAQFAHGAHYDMDILNLVFQRGLKASILSQWYVMHDHQWNEGKVEPKAIRDTYYVHYTSEKPFKIWQERDRIATQGFLNVLKGGFLYRTLWNEFDKHCAPIRKPKTVTLPVIAKDKGWYYPDPDNVLDYLQNNTDYLVQQKNKMLSGEN